jgi:hypothetical protein
MRKTFYALVIFWLSLGLTAPVTPAKFYKADYSKVDKFVCFCFENKLALLGCGLSAFLFSSGVIEIIRLLRHRKRQSGSKQAELK